MRIRALAALVPLAFAPAAFGQQQQVVKPPIAVYWASAATTSGMAASGGGAAGMMGMMLGGGGAQRTLDLRLGSSQAASGAPQAQHDIPPGLNMGPSLPLVTPVRAPAQPAPERDLPGGMEQPKGRLLIYWGCGEKAGAGQPVVIDFANVAAGQRPPNLVSRRVAVPVGPMLGRSRTYGDWPNQQDGKPVPADGSLKGDHTVKANYAPEIRFTVDERRDFMPGVALTSSATPAGARQVQWSAVAGATGYFMSAFGGKEDGSQVVMWTSSAVQEMGGGLMDYVPPHEVARLIRERFVLPPDTTQCTVPAEVLKAAEVPMMQFIAYGDELNVVHPPRPKDPKVAWEQQWAVKVRLKSTTMVPLADGMDMGSAATREPADREQARTPGAPSEAQQGQGGAVDQGVQILRGIFGR